MSQELRKALNKVEVTGVVKESKLNADKGENGNYINGSLIIKAGEFTEIEVRVFVSEKNKEGKAKKAYATLKQILDKEFKTIADGANEEEAVKVRIWGNGDFTPQFREEMYMTDNNPDVVTKISVDLGFGNVNIDEKITSDDYKATFDVEMFVARIEEEVKKDEETGRVIVKGYVPVYGGAVIPLEIIAGMVSDEEGEFDFAEQIRNNIDEGTTINLWGNIDYKTIIVKEKKDGSLGRAKTEENRTYIHDLIAIGGDIVEDSEKEFDEESIREAIKEREMKKEEVKNKEKDDDKGKKNKGLGNKSKSSGGSGKKDKLPF